MSISDLISKEMVPQYKWYNRTYLRTHLAFLHQGEMVIPSDTAMLIRSLDGMSNSLQAKESPDVVDAVKWLGLKIERNS